MIVVHHLLSLIILFPCIFGFMLSSFRPFMHVARQRSPMGAFKRAHQLSLTMQLNCGIVGLPNVGKSTLFNALVGSEAAQAANFPFCTIGEKTYICSSICCLHVYILV